MITLNQKTKLPWSTRFYGLAWLFILLLIITFLFSLGGHGADAFNYVGMFMIFIALWLLLDYACISYVVSEKTITINSGILVKRSKSIPFESIQNTTSNRGPMAMIFGISRINIWTASPAQIQIRNGNSENRPSGSLLLRKDDVEWLKEHILKNK
jgi:membrane protein YdbS with pleckstrin-like domain